MPILRLNAGPDGVMLYGSPAPVWPAIRTGAAGAGPVIVLIHGFKYDPCDVTCSPHTSIFGIKPRHHKPGNVQWLRPLGFGTGDQGEGLAVAFGWRARGNLWRAERSARSAGRHLAEVIALIRTRAPDRPIHVISHSMGSELIFEALSHLPAHGVQRIIALSGATYASRATAAMQSDAGRTAELFNVTSRENDVFDFLYERLIAPPVSGDRAMGAGIDLANVVNIQLDCSRTLAALGKYGGHIAHPHRRMCHWSGYTRPGALRFYAHALRNPDRVTLQEIRQALPCMIAPRWSRIVARPSLTLDLRGAEKNRAENLAMPL